MPLFKSSNRGGKFNMPGAIEANIFTVIKALPLHV